MAISFPNSPYLGQLFQVGTISFVWNGQSWDSAIAGAGQMNQYTVTNSPASITGTGQTVATATFVSNGYPLYISLNGDANPTSAGESYAFIQFYRDGTAIGNPFIWDSPSVNINISFNISVIDNPTAGSHTYTVKTVVGKSYNGSWTIGEAAGPQWEFIELSGAIGPTGAASTVTGPTGSAGLTGPTGSSLTGPTGPGGGSNYGNANVASFLASFGSNAITTTGNITAANFTGNISLVGNVQGTTANVTLVAGGYSATFDNTGMLTVPGTVGSTNYMVVNSANGQPEGGQVVLAWKGISGLTSQGNSTWNMDVDGSNQYRVFYQNAVGGAAVVMSANATTNDVTFASNVIVGGGQLNKVTTALNTVTATTTNPTKASSVTSDWITIVDEGNGWAVCSFSLSWSSSTGATNGSGSYLWLLPGGYQFNSTYHPFSTASAMPTSGADVRCILPGSAGHVSGSGFTGQLVMSAYDATHFRLVNFGLQLASNSYNYATSINASYVDNGDWAFANPNACWSGSFRFKKA